MHLTTLTVRNYRRIKDLTIDFDRSRTLLGGPNEAGKSTLAEAIHRALFCKAKGSGVMHKSMVSTLHGTPPEVSLSFEQSGETWTVEKRFSGTSGTTRLTSATGASFQSDEAEEKLAALLGNRDGTAKNQIQLDSRWSHLWVWQGTAGDDVGEKAVDQKNNLTRRLQSQGLAAVLQSDLDQSVRETVRADYLANFTATGKTASNSPLREAETRLAEAGQNFENATAQAAKLDEAVTNQSRATETLATSEKDLPITREALASTKESLARADQLAARLKEEKANLAQALETRNTLEKADQKITALHAQAAATAEKLKPLETRLADLATQEKETAAAATQAETSLTELANRTREARLLHDFVQSAVGHFEKEKSHAALAEKTGEVSQIHTELAFLRTVLAALPKITAADLKTLREVESSAREAESALAAIAAGIELLAGDLPVLLDGESLAPGTPKTITKATEILIGDFTCIRVNPGGGTSLALARETAADSRARFRQTLDRLTVSTTEEAGEIQSQRQILEQKIATTEARLKALGAEELPGLLLAAASARDAARAELTRRHEALTEKTELPPDPEAARALQKTAAAGLEKISAEEEAARQSQAALRAARDQGAAALSAHKSSLEEFREKLNELKVSARTLEETQGKAPERQAALAAAAEKIAILQKTSETTAADLAKLNPETLRADLARHQRKLKLLDEAILTARENIASSQAILTLDGSHDPEAAVTAARAGLARAEETHARHARQAAALALLENLFAEAQAETGRRITQPIADRVNAYLAALHGPGTRADLLFTEDGKAELTLTRPGEPTFPFAALSGGAKEQLAAAVRLAMAEILAADHGDCLPVLFDDAFAFADPDRTQALQRMLDLAATRGLQIIVLTCTPAAYSALAAKEISL